MPVSSADWHFFYLAVIAAGTVAGLRAKLWGCAEFL
jgi:hypothetical protein